MLCPFWRILIQVLSIDTESVLLVGNTCYYLRKMERNMKYNSFFLIIVSLLFFSGCASLDSSKSVLDESQASSIFFNEKNVVQTRAYRLYASGFKDDSATIEYLLNSVRYSPLMFCRNGKKYNGEQGYQLLSYKAEKFANEYESADEFIENVACYSRTSGEDYYVILEGKQYCPVRYVLFNELSRLRQLDKEAKQASSVKIRHSAGKMIDSNRGVNASPTIVSDIPAAVH